MAHHFPGREVSIRSGADDAAVRVELPLQDDDRVRGSVLVRAALEPSWVADQVVLLPAAGILIQQPHAVRLVVDGSGSRGGGCQLQ